MFVEVEQTQELINALAKAGWLKISSRSLTALSSRATAAFERVALGLAAARLRFGAAGVASAAAAGGLRVGAARRRGALGLGSEIVGTAVALALAGIYLPPSKSYVHNTLGEICPPIRKTLDFHKYRPLPRSAGSLSTTAGNRSRLEGNP